MSLPPFLRPIPLSDDLVPSENNSYLHAVFRHSDPLGSVHAIWWPSTEPIEDVILFIPGNPGLCSFYTEFLSGLHGKTSNLAILAHAHLGHTPVTIDQDIFRNPQTVTLENQVKSAVEAFDAIKLTLNPNRIVLISHSVGGWVVLQVLKARPNDISGAFLLFPTVCDLSESPNGRLLSRFFRPPMPFILSSISRIFQLVPFFVLRLLFLDWPIPQIYVLRGLLRSPAAIYASLTMAHDEMTRIRDLDINLINEHKDRIWLYFAKSDGWVGDSRQKILRALDFDSGSLRIVHGGADIPHAFCINHAQPLAKQCLSWVKSESLL